MSRDARWDKALSAPLDQTCCMDLADDEYDLKRPLYRCAACLDLGEKSLHRYVDDCPLFTDFDSQGVRKWERVSPPLHWPAAEAFIVADRHLPDGTRQHMIQGSAARGLVVNNAQVVGEDDTPQAEFSTRLSHLSRGVGGPNHE